MQHHPAKKKVVQDLGLIGRDQPIFFWINASYEHAVGFTPTELEPPKYWGQGYRVLQGRVRGGVGLSVWVDSQDRT